MALSRSVVPALVLVLLTLAGAAGAQTAVTRPGDTAKASVTIQQIDTTARIITYRSDDGTEDTVWAGPEIARFNELKVGDKVNVTYYESKIYQVRKSGTAAPRANGGTALTPSPGPTPGGTLARQSVQTVTVKAVDPSVPSITVTTAGGRIITRKVDKKSYLDGVNAGDKIDITTTEALLVSVAPRK